MATDWATILGTLLGSGVLISLITLLVNYLQGNRQRDFEARRDAKKYYLKLYAHIAILEELATSYQRSIKTGSATTFSFKDCAFVEHTSEKILQDYKEGYSNFSGFYLRNKGEGNEVFIPRKFNALLLGFWKSAMAFYDDAETMKIKANTDQFKKTCISTANYMTKLFGLSR